MTEMVLGELTKGDRMKIKTMITIEVHARDVLQNLINDRIETAASFAWQKQLKYRWDDDARDCFINIADAEFKYSHEYVGNCGRLVITALTDRATSRSPRRSASCSAARPPGRRGRGRRRRRRTWGAASRSG